MSAHRIPVQLLQSRTWAAMHWIPVCSWIVVAAVSGLANFFCSVLTGIGVGVVALLRPASWICC